MGNLIITNTPISGPIGELANLTTIGSLTLGNNNFSGSYQDFVDALIVVNPSFLNFITGALGPNVDASVFPTGFSQITNLSQGFAIGFLRGRLWCCGFPPSSFFN